MRLRQRDIERLPHQLDRLQLAFAPARRDTARVGEHDVVARGQRGEVGLVRVLVGDDEPQSGGVGEASEESGQQHHSAGREGRDGDLAARRVAVLRPAGFDALEGDGDVDRAFGEHASRRGEGEAAPGALGEGQSRLALEDLELLRDGRGGEGERLGDGGDGAALGELAKDLETMDVHVAMLNDQ